MIPPFAPSASYYKTIFTGEYNPADKVDGCIASRPQGRDAMRTLIAGPLLLSVPVEGGSSAIKHRGLRPDILLSQHGRWQQVHLGAWKATYGKSPYFTYLFPEIERVYLAMSHGTVADFTGELDRLARRWLCPEVFIEEFRRLENLNPKRAIELMEETKTKINYSYSIFDAIFRLGKNAMFGLMDRSC